MKHLTVFHREIKSIYIRTVLCVAALAWFFLPSLHLIKHDGDNMYLIYLNGQQIGWADSMEDAEDYLRQARLSLADAAGGLFYVDAQLSGEGSEVMIGQVDEAEDMIGRMITVLAADEKTDFTLAYMLKINEYLIAVDSVDSVLSILQAALDKYDTEGEFQVSLELDPSREINVLTTKVTTSVQREQESTTMPMAGIEKVFYEIEQEATESLTLTFDDFDYGLVDLYYEDEIEVIETYLAASELTDVTVATAELTEDQAKEEVYEVQSGDTLSQISLTVDIPLDQIIEMNDTLDDENSIIRVGDELVITIPQPLLSVGRTEVIYYEETYDADIEYVYNDDWYTTKSVTLTQPSAGYHNVAAVVTYSNTNEQSTEILKEEILVQPVAKVVEKGTQTPPTYIKPISGGTLSSGFGKRTSPTAGASSYHKGVDWATPVGTTVYASSAGTVTRAGWGSGYGYVVYITHADGRETRYAHLSKILVSVGQTVSQGQKIALSGNTGVSTGAHLHFEILINGSQVNPLNYLN